MSYIRSVLLVKPYVVVLASGTILATAFGLIAVKLFTNYKQWVNNNKSKKFKSKHKYPKYTVILHQYRRGLRAPSLSPCALKLETFLRMTNVTYQNVYGNCLYISYNDERVYYSDSCIKFLVNKLGKNLDKDLNEQQLALSRVIIVLVEESLKWCLIIHRYLYQNDESLKKTPIGDINYQNVKQFAYAHGYGRHTREELYSIGKLDLKALNDLISTKKFFFGSQPSTVDAVVFAFLAQIINHDSGPFNDFVNKECSNLIRFHDTVKKTFWKDWYSVIEDKSDEKIYFYLPENH